MTALYSKLVTSGFGPKRSVAQSAGLIVQGYGKPPTAIVEAIERPLRLRLGQSGTKRRLAELEEVIVWAKLIEMNGTQPTRTIKGWIRARVQRSRGFASVMAESVRVIRDYVKVTVERLK